MEGSQAVNGAAVAAQVTDGQCATGEMLVGSQDLEGVLVFRVAPAHAGYGERVAYERVHKEVWMGSCQCRKSSRVIVQPVSNGATNPSSTKAVREEQDVPAAEVVQTQDLLRDRWRNSLALA